FMFLAPLLYVVHALLTGVSMFVAASFEWTAGFSFSAGLIDFLLSSRIPIANQPYMLMVQGAGFFILYYIIFRVLITALNIKTPGRDASILGESEDVTVDTQEEVAVHPVSNTAGQDKYTQDRKSTRLNSSHVSISYAVFCLKKKK